MLLVARRDDVCKSASDPMLLKNSAAALRRAMGCGLYVCATLPVVGLHPWRRPSESFSTASVKMGLSRTSLKLRSSFRGTSGLRPTRGTIAVCCARPRPEPMRRYGPPSSGARSSLRSGTPNLLSNRRYELVQVKVPKPVGDRGGSASLRRSPGRSPACARTPDRVRRSTIPHCLSSMPDEA